MSDPNLPLRKSLRDREGDDEREPLSLPIDEAESVDLVREDNTNEVLDAVDDNIQEPPQIATDEDDESDVAEQP